MRIAIALLLLTQAASAATTVTGYCACARCCGVWAGGKTSNGSKPQQGVTVAASRSIPMGTRVRIQGVGVRVVQDRLAVRYDNRVDVFFASHADAIKFGKRNLRVEVIK